MKLIRNEKKVGCFMKKSIVIGIVVIVVVFLFINSNTWWPFGKGNQEVEVTNDIEKIEIDLASVHAIIIPENRDTVKVDLDGKGRIEIDDSKEQIEMKYKRNWFEGFSSFGKTEVKIYLPQDYDRELEIEVGSGHLQFNHQAKEGLHLEKLAVDIGSGDIEMDSISVDQAEFNVSSGEVEVTHFKGPVDADVSSGSFKIQLDELNNDIELDVSSGFASVDLPEDANFTLNGKISSGELSNHFELTDKQEDKDRISGKHGTGEHHIDVDVSSGHVEIR